MKTSDATQTVSAASYIPNLHGVLLERLYEYHQRPDIHPSAAIIPPYYERVELMTGGRGWINDNGAWREVLPGDLIWNKPGQRTIGRSDFKNPYRCLAATIVTPQSHGMGVPRFSQVADIEAVVLFTHEVIALFRDDTFDRDALTEYVLARLLFWVRMNEHRVQKPELPPAIDESIKWMEKHYAEPCSIGEMAKRAGWSAAHFHEAFRQAVGTTPHKMLARYRLRAARDCLVSTSHPVKRIATDCGFADASALIHAFKADTGLTPSAYRKRYMRLELDRPS
ncbi:MAG: helix-turn-helix domain-containing protein [Candidatus Methylacidiphilales bacterium]|nr:AraC family transcriptional regulator [Candidatus Methylacidiphilales bacterium]